MKHENVLYSGAYRAVGHGGHVPPKALVGGGTGRGTAVANTFYFLIEIFLKISELFKFLKLSQNFLKFSQNCLQIFKIFTKILKFS